MRSVEVDLFQISTEDADDKMETEVARSHGLASAIKVVLTAVVASVLVTYGMDGNLAIAVTALPLAGSLAVDALIQRRGYIRRHAERVERVRRLDRRRDNT